MCGVRSPCSAEGTNVWNYTSIWSGGKKVLLGQRLEGLELFPHLEQRPRMWHVHLHYIRRSAVYVNILLFKVKMKIFWNYAYI
jgi:hypothetical protein